MRSWWRPRRAHGADSETVLRLESELRAARLELSELQESRRRVEADLARERERSGAHAEQSARAGVARLLSGIGTPVVQLVTLTHLRETGTAEPSVGDVLDLAGRLVRGLEDHGLQLCGVVDGCEAFDPGRHDPLGQAAPAPGALAVIRFVGLSYQGRTLRKAGVQVGG